MDIFILLLSNTHFIESYSTKNRLLFFNLFFFRFIVPLIYAFNSVLLEKNINTSVSSYCKNDTCFNTAGGVPRYYGNIVGTDAYTGEEYGSANCIRIDFNVDNINNAIEQGLDRVLLNKGVASHEIGHNLGGEHSDKTPTMSIVNTISTVDIS